MEKTRRFSVLAIVAVFVVAVVVIAAVLANGTARAQTATPESQPAAQQPEEPLRTIQVAGQSVVSAEPDQAVVTFGVQTQATSAAEALQENNTMMQQVISATVGFGIAEDNIQTRQIRLDPIYNDTPNANQPATIESYRATNSVVVTTQQIDDLGALLDTAVEAGANSIEGIQFEISDRQALAAQAREEAVNNARDKAEQLAELTDAELGPVLTISESAIIPQPQPLRVQEMAAAAGAVPIAPGAQTIEANVQISWLLE